MSSPFDVPRSCYCIGPPWDCPCARIQRRIDGVWPKPPTPEEAAREAIQRIFGPDFSSIKDKEVKQVKLTKEQWTLISSVLNKLSENGVLNKHDILNVLSKHVEKEFPEIHMRPKHVDDEEHIKVYETDCDNAGQKCIVIFSYEEHTHMSREQFREFAEKINKIVEWLDEAN